MSMTKKDYEATASAIRTIRDFYGESGAYIEQAVVDNIAHQLGMEYGLINVKFDNEKFLTKCGVAK